MCSYVLQKIRQFDIDSWVVLFSMQKLPWEYTEWIVVVIVSWYYSTSFLNHIALRSETHEFQTILQDSCYVNLITTVVIDEVFDAKLSNHSFATEGDWLFNMISLVPYYTI